MISTFIVDFLSNESLFITSETSNDYGTFDLTLRSVCSTCFIYSNRNYINLSIDVCYLAIN